MSLPTVPGFYWAKYRVDLEDYSSRVSWNIVRLYEGEYWIVCGNDDVYQEDEMTELFEDFREVKEPE